ncbi:MAG: hypothetical protein WCQ47_07910, partial [bacterium]
DENESKYYGSNYEVMVKKYKNGLVLIVRTSKDKVDFDLRDIPQEVVNNLIIEHNKGKELVDVLNIKNITQNGRFLQKINYESLTTTLMGNYFILTPLDDEEQMQVEEILVNTIPGNKKEDLFNNSDFNYAVKNISELKDARSKIMNYTALKSGSNTQIIEKTWAIVEEELNNNEGRLSQKTLSLISSPDVIKLMNTVSNFSSNKLLYDNKMLEIMNLMEKISKDINTASFYTSMLEKRLSDFRRAKELIKR